MLYIYVYGAFLTSNYLQEVKFFEPTKLIHQSNQRTIKKCLDSFMSLTLPHTNTQTLEQK